MRKEKGSTDDLSELSLKRFTILSTIGKGAFGSVKAIQDKKSKKKYALKFINKNHCIEDKATTLIFKERMMLQELSHPFIIALRYAFQDDEHLFMVLDLALGGDLRYNMYKCPMFDDHTLVVYTAEISSAVAYMHSKLIIHRDLKPENLLLDENGHIYLTDLNLATSLQKRKPTSQSGTLDYMAPEMHISKPYGYSIDWWALGTILYECVYRRLPFGGGKTAEEVAENSRSVPLVFPERNFQKMKVENSKERIDFITGCLQREVKDRLGSKNDGLGFESEIKVHPYLSRVDWNLVNEKKLVPKYKPLIDKDNLNISPNVLIEEMLGGQENLQYKPRKKKVDPNDPNRKLTFTEKLTNSMNNLFGVPKSPIHSHNGSSPDLPLPKPKTRKQIEKEQMDEYYIPFDWELPNQRKMVLPEEPKHHKSNGSSSSRQRADKPSRDSAKTNGRGSSKSEKTELSSTGNIARAESSPNMFTASEESLTSLKNAAKKASPLREASLPQDPPAPILSASNLTPMLEKIML